MLETLLLQIIIINDSIIIITDKVFPRLLITLCNNNANESVKNQQALAKQLADVFDFVLRFDDCKVLFAVH